MASVLSAKYHLLLHNFLRRYLDPIVKMTVERRADFKRRLGCTDFTAAQYDNFITKYYTKNFDQT